MVVIREYQTGVAIDLLTAEGSLSGKLPLFKCLDEDPLLLGTDADTREVLVVSSIEDVAVLRGCGIPATLATGLDRLTAADTRRLSEIFALRLEPSRRRLELETEGLRPDRDIGSRSGPNAEPALDEQENVTNHWADEVKPNLILVGWSPATQGPEAPQLLTATANRLQELHRHMGLDLFEVYAWRPSSADMSRLRFFVDCADAEQVREALLDSIFESLLSIDAFCQKDVEQPTIPQDLSSAILMLRDVMVEDTRDGASRREALTRVERMIHEQLIQPMMAEALDRSNPTERATGVAAAQMVWTFLTQGTAISIQLSKSLTKAGTISDALPEGTLENWLRTGDRLTKLIRDFDRCKQPEAIDVKFVPNPSRLSPPGSD